MAHHSRSTWKTNYWRNPAVGLRFDLLEPPYQEEQFQILVDTILQTVFVATENYSLETKHRWEGTEPDSKVLRLVEYNAGNTFHDVLVIEIKRQVENLSDNHFTNHKELLDDHLGESANPNNTQIFGAIVIGRYIKFYRQVLGQNQHSSRLGLTENTDARMLHLWDDRVIVQRYFEHIKQHGGRP